MAVRFRSDSKDPKVKVIHSNEREDVSNFCLHYDFWCAIGKSHL